jgi:hypothetical protein
VANSWLRIGIGRLCSYLRSICSQPIELICGTEAMDVSPSLTQFQRLSRQTRIVEEKTGESRKSKNTSVSTSRFACMNARLLFPSKHYSTTIERNKTINYESAYHDTPPTTFHVFHFVSPKCSPRVNIAPMY